MPNATRLRHWERDTHEVRKFSVGLWDVQLFLAFVQLMVDFSSLDKASVGKPVRDRKTEFKKEAEKKSVSHAARDKTRDKILLRSRHSLKTQLRPQMFLTFNFSRY